MLRASRKLLLCVAVVAVCLPLQANHVSAERAGTPTGTAARDIAKRFVAGTGFTCLLGGEGTIRCWGVNSAGQIGDGDNTSPVLTPTLVSGITNAVEIAAGASHACALLQDATMKCWGFGGDGQLGNDTLLSSNVPVVVKNAAGSEALAGIRTIAAADQHTCAVRNSDGAVFCWGDEIAGHLGNGSTSSLIKLPVQVRTDASTFLSGIVEIAAGAESTCGLKTDGTAYCWGSNAYGQLGNDTLVDSAYAIRWGTATDLQAISIGGQHICGFTTGALSCAGGSTGGYVFSQMLQKKTLWTTPNAGLRQVATTNTATCYIDSSSALVCAGGLMAGMMRNVWSDGFGATGFFFTSASISNVQAIAAGEDHFCAYLDISIKCWGANGSGQLGGGSTSVSETFTSVAAAVPGSVSIVDPGAQDVSSSTFNVSATSNSGGVMTYSVLAGSAGVCSVDNSGVVTVIGAGTCEIKASVASAGLFTAANSTRAITVSALVPSVTATSATAVEFTSATLSASVNPRGAATSSRFRYGLSASLEAYEEVVIAGSQTGVSSQSVSTALTSLKPGTTYYMRLVSSSSIGLTSGAVVSFTTKGSTSRVTTGGATSTPTTASINADVIANDVETTVSFEYGSDANLATSNTAAVEKTVTGAATSAVSANLTKLTPATTYYYRVVGVNAVGTSRGDIKSFTTKGAKPTALSGSSTPTATRATLNGRVNPGELETTISFEYGTDAKLVGATSTASQVKSGSEDLDVSAVITNLEERTTYYYRIVAVNVVGTTKGDIKSFSTTRPEGVSINNGDEFTSSQSVTVSVVGPSTAVKAILSNDGGFATSETFDLVNNAAEIPWTLQSSKEGTFTKIVYVKYVSRFGSNSTPYTDDIILDTTKPAVSTATAAVAAPTGDAVQVARIGVKAAAKGGVRLSVRGSDTISGVGSVEVRSSAAKAATTIKLKSVAGKADGKARPMSQTISLKSTAKRLQIRVIDRAGNASAWRTINVK